MFEKPHYHRNSVAIKFLVFGRHFNVNFLLDFEVQKCGVIVELPILKVVLRRCHQYYTNALKPADRSEYSSAVVAWYLSPMEHNDSSLVEFVGLDLVHPTRTDDLVASWSGGCRNDGVDAVPFQLCNALVSGRLPVCLIRQGRGFFKGV